MTRRTISWPVLCVATAAIAAAGTGTYFLHQWQLGRLSQTLLGRAETEEQRAAWHKAANLLDQYLRLRPRDAPIRVRLANTYAKGSTTLEEKERAVALHYRALGAEANDESSALRAELASLLLEVGRLVEAEREAQQVLEWVPEHPLGSRVYALSRYLQWTSGLLSSKPLQDLALLSMIEEALQRNPGDMALAEAAATIYRQHPAVVKADRNGKPPLDDREREHQADAIFDKALEQNDRDPKAYLARHVYRVRYGVAGAAEDVRQAQALAPNDAQVLLFAGVHHYREAKHAQAANSVGSDVASDFHKAKELFERIIDQDKTYTNAEPYLRLGDTLVHLDDLEQALAIWRRSAERFRKPTVVVLFHARLADHLLHAGRAAEAKFPLEAADAILAELGGVIPRNDHLVLLQAQGLRRARYHLQSGRYADAIDDLQQAIARQPKLQPDPRVSSEAWDLLGRAYGGLEDWTTAATAFDRAANFQSSAVAPRLAAAQAWLASGRMALAIDRAEEVLSLQALPEAWLILGTAELQNQMLTPPLERKWQRIEEALAKLDGAEASAALLAPWRTDFLRADYCILRGQTEDRPEEGRAAAVEALRVAETKYQERDFWFQVCLAYERLDSPRESQRALERLGQLPESGLDAAIASARRAAWRDDFTEATRIVEQARLIAPQSVQVRLQKELLRIAQSRQDLPRMRALLQAELQQHPSDVGVLCRLAELDQREEKWQALGEWEIKLAAAGPLGEMWARYFRIVRLYSTANGAADARLTQALSEQAQLATLRPNWAESFALRGAIEQRLGHLEQAAAAYEQAIDLGDNRYGIFEQIIACLDQLPDRTADVERYLSRLEGYLPNSQRLTEVASQRQLDGAHPRRAVEIARRAVTQRPQDLAAKLWLGRLLLATDQRGEAQAIFEQATKDAPADVRSWHGLFDYYARTGDHQRGAAALDSLATNARANPVELELMLARGYVRLKDPVQAVRHLEAAIALAPQRAELHLELARICAEEDRERAKQCLKTAIQLQPDLAPARYLLAMLLAAGGSDAELAEAEALLGGSSPIRLATQQLDDRRVQAMLLAQHGGDKGMARAIQILEQLVSERSPSKNDRLLLAQFLERSAAATPDPLAAAAIVQRAREQLEKLAHGNRVKPSDLSALVTFLLRHDCKSDASDWLDRLESLIRRQTSGEEAALAQLIELRLQHGSIDRCEPLLERLEKSDRDPLRPLLVRIRFLHAAGRDDAIEATLEKRATELIQAAVDKIERIRIARAVGDLYTTLNRLAGAERWYRVVVREDHEQYSNLALTLLRQGKAREAILLCQAAGENDKTSRPAVILTTVLLQAGGKPEHIALAEEALLAALARFPDDSNLLYGVGMLRIFQDRYDDAITLLSQVIQLSPYHVSALNNLAVVVAETPERRDEAIALVERAIEVKGHEPTLLDTKGTILVSRGDTEVAIPLLEAAARGPTADPRHRFHLAMAYSDSGSTEKAREQFELALRNDLESQILTPTDRKLIVRLKSLLNGKSL
jgi:tetratricopeptide (TPR) repeat protein